MMAPTCRPTTAATAATILTDTMIDTGRPTADVTWQRDQHNHAMFAGQNSPRMVPGRASCCWWPARMHALAACARAQEGLSHLAHGCADALERAAHICGEHLSRHQPRGTVGTKLQAQSRAAHGYCRQEAHGSCNQSTAAQPEQAGAVGTGCCIRQVRHIWTPLVLVLCPYRHT